MKKLFAVLLALVIVIGAFAACGNKEDDGTTNAPAATKLKVVDIALTSEEYAFAVTKGNEELLKSLNDFLAKIKEDGTFEAIMDKYFGDGTPEGVLIADTTVDTSNDNQLVIATNAEFAPFEYVEGEYYFGVDIEIMNLFAKSLGKTLAVTNMEFDSVCTAVGEGLCDIAASGLTIKPEREEILDFSTPYYNASQKIITLESDTSFDNCKTVEDAEAVLKGFAEGTKVGFQTGTTGAFYISGDADWDFEGFSNLVGTGYSNGAIAVQDILNGNIAFVVIDDAPANNIVAAVNG